ncbi:MAG: hypothetical protein QOF89_6102 [Acidobacteriota bacterium]|jgi:hypothetical protein|nr:hypothetical protein [Acidobacteriota bacterium]
MNTGDDQEHRRRPEEARQAENESQMGESPQAQGGGDRPSLHRAVQLSRQGPAQHESRDGQDEEGERDLENQRGGLEEGGHDYWIETGVEPGLEPGLETIQVSR